AGVARGLRDNVVAGLYAQRPVPGSAVAFALVRRLIAVELQRVQRNGIEYLADLAARGIDEKPYRGDEGRQRGDDLPGLADADRTRAWRIEHQPDCIGPGIHRDQCILDPSDSADLATNDRQLNVYLQEKSADGNKSATACKRPAVHGKATGPAQVAPLRTSGSPDRKWGPR